MLGVGLLGMRDVGEVGCFGCRMFWKWDVDLQNA